MKKRRNMRVWAGDRTVVVKTRVQKHSNEGGLVARRRMPRHVPHERIGALNN